MAKPVLLVIMLAACFLFWSSALSYVFAANGSSLYAIGKVALAVVLTFILGFVAGTPK